MSRVVGWSVTLVTVIGLTTALWMARGPVTTSNQQQEVGTATVALRVEGMT